MKRDSLTEFVNGNYSHMPSAAQLRAAKWIARFSVIFLSIFSLLFLAELINEIRPAWRLETADAVVVSKYKKRTPRLQLHGRIQWTFLEQYDPEKTSYSGSDKVSLGYLSKIEIGDTIRVQYNPTKKHHSPDNVRIKGSTPIFFIFIHLLFVCFSFYANRYLLRMLRFARRDPAAFEKMIIENKRSQASH